MNVKRKERERILKMILPEYNYNSVSVSSVCVVLTPGVVRKTLKADDVRVKEWMKD